ncbi:MAG: hypothetical protein SF123_18865 [Chloroflexota bacterium]|nr:hypothetical protein [Chloroflexota bacterium]
MASPARTPERSQHRRLTITWQLWRLLVRPPMRSPIFRRAQELPPPPKRKRLPRDWDLFPLLFVIVLAAIFPALLILIVFGGLLILVLTIPLSNTGYSIRAMASVAPRLATEVQNGTFTVLSVTPAGAFGSLWALITGTLNQKVRFDGYPLIQIIGITLGAIGMFWAFLGTLTALARERELFWMPGLILILSMTLFRLDYIYSMVAGMLTAMLSVSITRQAGDAAALAIGMFIGVQVGVYLPPAFMVLVYTRLNTQLDYAPLRDIAWIAMTTAVFLLLREGANILLWRQVCNRLDISPNVSNGQTTTLW